MAEAQQEQSGAVPSPVELEKAAYRAAVRQGEQRGRRLQLIWTAKLMTQLVREAGIGLDVPDGHGTDPAQPHDWIDTGDPCWCGSDNCAVCLVCLEENHD